MNINEFQPTSGRFVKEDGTTVNIADELGGKSVSDKVYDIDNMMPHSGRFIKEDGTTVNIADMIANGDIGGGGGSDSGSSDDSAPPIVETYNGQTIQCSMSADRPLQGLNLYATCEQKTTTGANLFDASLMPTTSGGGATVTNNGDGSFTISGEGQITEEGFLLNVSVSGDDAKKMLKAGNIYTNGQRYAPSFYAYGIDNTGKVLFNTSGASGSAVITNEILEALSRLQFVFYGTGGLVITPVTFFPMIWQTGDGAYEPYTGGIPSPNGDYPQEIQAISDFVVEVKNSMGEVATPQTLNVTIPEQGFYGIPVPAGGNYTDTDGQQWICDEFDYKRGKYIQRVRKVILNGSESERWNLHPVSESKNFVTLYRKFEGTKIGQGTSICNMFINKRGATWETGGIWVYTDHFTLPNKYFNVPKTTLNTLEEWKTWLSTHPLEVLCSLATPVEYDLTDEQVEQYKKLRSYYKTTYIDNNAAPACNMQAELVLDTKLYIDNKFTTLAGQILEMGV